jgi:excisionase family DNA binding protein
MTEASIRAVIGIDEAAGMLGVDRETVRRWANSGKLDVAYKGRGRRGAIGVSRSQVERLARARSGRPAHTAECLATVNRSSSQCICAGRRP